MNWEWSLPISCPISHDSILGAIWRLTIARSNKSPMLVPGLWVGVSSFVINSSNSSNISNRMSPSLFAFLHPKNTCLQL